MPRTSLILFALVGLLTVDASAQSARQLPVVRDSAELVLAVDCRAIYNDPTFDAVMDLVEASEEFARNAERLAAWGFDPRSDLREVVFVVADLGTASGEFLIVASGDLAATEIDQQLREGGLVTRGTDDAGEWWAYDDVRFIVTPTVAIAGVGALFEHARTAIHSEPAQVAESSPHALELHVRVDEELRGIHPALGAHLLDLVASLELGREPTFHLRAETPSPESASQAVGEVAQILQSVLDVPEVRAMGLGGLLENANVAAEGATVEVTAVLDAESWARFSATLSDLVEEELR